MAFAVTNDFTSGTTAQAAQVNTNFGDVETELNAFPTDGTFKDGGVSTTAKLADNIVTWAKLAVALAKDEDDMASNSATAVASQQSIKAYVDANIGSANWSPTSYAGGETTTSPNNLIVKMGSAAYASSPQQIAFSTAFPNAIVSVTCSPIYSSGSGVPPYITAMATTHFWVKIYDIAPNYYNWIAIGY